MTRLPVKKIIIAGHNGAGKTLYLGSIVILLFAHYTSMKEKGGKLL